MLDTSLSIFLQLARGNQKKEDVVTLRELYQEFLNKFPAYEAMVRTVHLIDGNTIQITTKQNKSFIFRKTENSFELKAVK